jgi:hypothetical protein
MTTVSPLPSGVVRQSRTARNPPICVECHNPYVYDEHRPRYCDCLAYHRDPTLPEQCTQCWRRINPRYDQELNHDT